MRLVPVGDLAVSSSALEAETRRRDLERAPTYRLWVSDDGKVLVRLWALGNAEVATRENSWESWGPPRRLVEEKV